jgi:hypothetical protein
VRRPELGDQLLLAFGREVAQRMAADDAAGAVSTGSKLSGSGSGCTRW